MAFMDKVKFWKKDDDDFSFNDSSNMGDDPFSNSTDLSSGLPPDPMSSNSSFGSDPYASDPMTNKTSSGDTFGSPSTSSQNFGGDMNSSSGSDPFGSSQNTQDPFARPSVPPKSATIGQSLAHNYMQGQHQTSSSPAMVSAPLKPGSETEMISLKLDAIRSELNAVSQRMMRLEHLIEEQSKKRGW